MVSSGGYNFVVLCDAVFRTNVARTAKETPYDIHSFFPTECYCNGLPDSLFLVWEVDCVLNLKHGFDLSVGWLFLIEHGYTDRWMVCVNIIFQKSSFFFYHQSNSRNGIR
jgi:hypothetical protein